MHNIFSGQKRDGVLLVAKAVLPAGSVCVTQLCVCAVLVQQAAAKGLLQLHGGSREVGWQTIAISCSLLSPAEFSTYLNFCRSLRFDDKPDYSYLRQLFRNLFHRQGFSYDYVFDWNMLKFVSVFGKRAGPGLVCIMEMGEEGWKLPTVVLSPGEQPEQRDQAVLKRGRVVWCLTNWGHSYCGITECV